MLDHSRADLETISLLAVECKVITKLYKENHYLILLDLVFQSNQKKKVFGKKIIKYLKDVLKNKVYLF